MLRLPVTRQPLHSQRKAGFTLIEFMIVTTLGILLMLTASSVFLTILVGRAKTATSQRLKAEGDYAMSQMEFLIRNAVELLPTTGNPAVFCTEGSDTGEVVVKSVDGTTTRFTRQTNNPPNTNRVISVTSGGTNVLTSSAVDVTSGPSFRCIDQAGTRYFTITFTLRKNGISQVFNSSVNMRNY